MRRQANAGLDLCKPITWSESRRARSASILPNLTAVRILPAKIHPWAIDGRALAAASPKKALHLNLVLRIFVTLGSHVLPLTEWYFAPNLVRKDAGPHAFDLRGVPGQLKLWYLPADMAVQ